jgi:hypothetical protein
MFAVTITPWAIRNACLQGTFTGIDVMGGRNFMMGNYEYTPLFRAWDAISVSGERSWHAILSARIPEFQSATQGERDKLAFKYGLQFAMDHPGQTAQRSLVKMANFWQLEREFVAGISQGLWGKHSASVVLGTALVVCGAYAATMFLAAYGLIVWPQPLRNHGILLLLIGLVWGVHTLVFAHSRYHLPLMPLVLIYAASGIVNAPLLWSSRRTPRFFLAGLICLVLSGTWLWELVAIDNVHLVELIARLC